MRINRRKLKTLLKKIPGVQYFTWFRSSKIIWPAKFWLNQLKIKAIKSLKNHGYTSDNDNELIKLKGIHSSKSCVIIGNGPSLRIEDLEILKREKIITFGCNRINELFPITTWRPDYYCLSDSTVFEASYLNMDSEKLISDLHNANVRGIFLIENMKRHLKSDSINTNKILFFRMSLLPPYSIKMQPFSVDISHAISDLGTVAGTCIQVAAYMGFENIYLYGIDNTFIRYFGSDGKFHIDLDSEDYAQGISSIPSNKIQSGDLPKSEYRAALQQNYVDLRKFDVGFSTCAKYIKGKNINIYNITRGGKLEAFERRNIDELFLLANKNNEEIAYEK